MKLTTQVVNRDGKRYRDYYLNWEYEGKQYAVRVIPCFKKDYVLLFANSEPLPEISK